MGTFVVKSNTYIQIENIVRMIFGLEPAMGGSEEEASKGPDGRQLEIENAVPEQGVQKEEGKQLRTPHHRPPTPHADHHQQGANNHCQGHAAVPEKRVEERRGQPWDKRVREGVSVTVVELSYVERQFGVLEVHHADQELVDRAGAAILEGIGASPADALRPHILYADVIEQITDQHAVIINRNRDASMVLPGETLLVYEVTPALFAAVAANAAERVSPEATLVNVSMIGAAGRIYITGSTESVERARDEITRVLESVEGREH